MKYKWSIKEDINLDSDFLNAAFNSEVIATLLKNRGIDTAEKANEYLDPKKYKESKPEEIPELLKAKDKIISTINNGGKITIFGDYDVDGVTSTACLLITLKQYTENVDYYIPNRLLEGYGLNKTAVETISKKHKADLLITCDCGVTNHAEIEHANSLGMDVIVTDHHSLPDEMPKAHAVLNPKVLPEEHKLHFLPGVGVAYKLAEEILDEMPNEKIKKEDLLDLVTLGMIADLAPLVDENRYLVQIGIEKLANTKKVGLKELLRVCGANKDKGVTTDQIGFGIAPRINAVGRLTDANLAVKLLTTDNEIEALHLACELDIQNKERQVICDETLKDAVTLVSEQVDLKKDRCIVLAKEGWHHGIVGIVASRVVEKYHLPTILMGIDEEQDIARGSGRSISSLNILEALSMSSDSVEKFGGHKAACGLSIKPENIPAFISDFKSSTSKLLGGEDITPKLAIDMDLPLSKVNLELLDKINVLSPFGLGNKMAVFASNEIEVANVRTIGKDRNHLKLLLKDNESQRFFEALIWNYNPKDFNYDSGLKTKDKIKVAFTPKLNHFNGEVVLQLEIKDYEVTKSTQRLSDIQPTTSGTREVELYDFRGRRDECINALSKNESNVFFAETIQKEILPLKTFSRNFIGECESLILLEPPPDEIAFNSIVEKSNASKLFLAFDSNFKVQSSGQEIIKRLIGMLKYVSNNKGGKVAKSDLEAALGINRTSLVFALEVLSKTGFLTYKQSLEEISVNIQEPTRQIFSELIEYNLFVSEVKQIANFKEMFILNKIQEIAKKLSKNDVANLVIKEKALI